MDLEGIDTWVDLSVLNAVLAGVLILLAAVWALVVFNRLWQLWLSTQAADGIGAAQAQGLVLQPMGLRARVIASGVVAGRSVRVEWRGGVTGPHTRVVQGGAKRRLPLVTDAAQLAAALKSMPAATPAA